VVAIPAAEQAALEAMGRTAVNAFRDQGSWVHRRVETLTFPTPADLVSWRKVSVDFTVPALLPTDLGRARLPPDFTPPPGGPTRYYVPISQLKRWPPILRLDLKSARGESLPLLTAQQNGYADYGLLAGTAEQVAGCSEEHCPDVYAALHDIAGHSGRPRAKKALHGLIRPDAPDEYLDEVRRRLRSDRFFLDLASLLLENTILWFPATGAPGRREIVKFAYAEPVQREPIGLRASLGVQVLNFQFEAPHVGSVTSYHFNVRAPEPLQTTDAQVLVLQQPIAFPPDPPPGGPEVVASCAASENLKEEGGLALEAYVAGREAHAYVSGHRGNCAGEVWVSLLVEKSGMIRGAAITACAIFGLLLTYRLNLSVLLTHPEASVAVLLIAPTVLAYLLVQPSQHVLALQFLKTLRALVLMVGALPMIGAASIVVSSEFPCYGMRLAWTILSAAGGILALLLIGSALLPVRGARCPLSTDADDIKKTTKGGSGE
jgi:hypothetical protein